MDNITTILQTVFLDAFSWIKTWFLIKISRKFAPKGPMDNII